MIKKIWIMVSKIIIVTLILQNIFIPISNAGFWDDVIESGTKFIKNGQSQANNAVEINDTNFNALINQIYNALLTLGVVLSVLIGAVLGIKFMVGSIEQQAKIKEKLLAYTLGCVVTFCAFGIWKLMMILLEKL